MPFSQHLPSLVLKSPPAINSMFYLFSTPFPPTFTSCSFITKAPNPFICWDKTVSGTWARVTVGRDGYSFNMVKYFHPIREA